MVVRSSTGRRRGRCTRKFLKRPKIAFSEAFQHLGLATVVHAGNIARVNKAKRARLLGTRS